MDFDKPIRVMIEFISHHAIAFPLTKIPYPPIPLRLLHTTFERIKIENAILETKITGNRIVLVCKSKFLKAIGIEENHLDFKVHERIIEEFQLFLTHIGYGQEYKAKKFKKSAVLGLWTVLMHFIVSGLSGKHGGTDTLRVDWLYLV